MLTSQPTLAWSRMLAVIFTATFLATAGPAMAADTAPPQAAPAATFQVEVIGAVLRPGNVELKDGDRLLLAIARAGTDVSLNPDLTNVCVAHMATVNRTTVIEVTAPSMECTNVYKALERGDRSFDPVLRPGDVVVVMAKTQKTRVREST
ncbi:MAG: hypothetical protein QOF71_1105 [Candidatus Eremiobacteraeota bacterium]|jgi:protein involved in polysaccharide export with SLBB domain|nr:hypothetical protein [Candidatus Eremiobacteraeota bacterium]